MESQDSHGAMPSRGKPLAALSRLPSSFPANPQNMRDTSGGYCQILKTSIPQNLAPEYRISCLTRGYNRRRKQVALVQRGQPLAQTK